MKERSILQKKERSQWQKSHCRMRLVSFPVFVKRRRLVSHQRRRVRRYVWMSCCIDLVALDLSVVRCCRRCSLVLQDLVKQWRIHVVTSSRQRAIIMPWEGKSHICELTISKSSEWSRRQICKKSGKKDFFLFLSFHYDCMHFLFEIPISLSFSSLKFKYMYLCKYTDSLLLFLLLCKL